MKQIQYLDKYHEKRNPECDYILEVRNRFRELAVIECLMNYRQRFVTLYRRQSSRPSLRKRNVKKQNCYLRMPYK